MQRYALYTQRGVTLSLLGGLSVYLFIFTLFMVYFGSANKKNAENIPCNQTYIYPNFREDEYKYARYLYSIAQGCFFKRNSYSFQIVIK